ncbi:MAG: YegP family protein [Planctomycetales bacterium]|nr:YegP family protein [Planctomycetales bacterium]
MKIEYWKSPKNGQWYFAIIARNGKTIAQSEGYKRERNCIKTANRIADESLLNRMLVAPRTI